MRPFHRKSTATLWIFCEGKDEREYFDDLRCQRRIRHLNIQTRGQGHTDAVGLVNEAKKFINSSCDYQTRDLVACVFDRDENLEHKLEQAEAIAKDACILTIFSNPCFEYWFLCHYEQYGSACELARIEQRLKNYIPGYYKGMEQMYSTTKNNLATAISNAKKTKNLHLSKPTLISRKTNPISLAFELIETIDKFA